jgi:hypothetical protein
MRRNRRRWIPLPSPQVPSRGFQGFQISQIRSHILDTGLAEDVGVICAHAPADPRIPYPLASSAICITMSRAGLRRATFPPETSIFAFGNLLGAISGPGAGKSGEGEPPDDMLDQLHLSQGVIAATGFPFPQRPRSQDVPKSRE